MTISRDADEAQVLGAKSIDQTVNIYIKNPVGGEVNHGPVPDAPQQAHGGLEAPLDEFIIGTPVQLAEQIIEQCRATGAGHFVARIEGHGDARDERRAFDLFGQEVVPILRRAAV